VYIYIKYKEQQLLLIFAVFHLSNSLCTPAGLPPINNNKIRVAAAARESETQAEEIEITTIAATSKIENKNS